MSTYFCCPLCRMSHASIGLVNWDEQSSGERPMLNYVCRSCLSRIAGAEEVERADLLSKVELFMERKSCYEKK